MLKLCVGGVSVKLHWNHYAILITVMCRKSSTYEDLAVAMWGPASCWPEDYGNNIRANMWKLNKILQDAGCRYKIKKQYKFGYRLDVH